MHSVQHRTLLPPIIISLALTLIAVWLQVSPPAGVTQWITRFDHLIYDARVATTRPLMEDEADVVHPVVIVDIDERSLAEQGRWPWSRTVMADLTEQLAEAGVLMVGFDILFSEPEDSPVVDLVQRLEADDTPGLDEHLEALGPMQDPDAHLAQTLPRTESILGFLLHNDAEGVTGQLPDPIPRARPEQPIPEAIRRFHGATASLPELADSAMGAGFITTVPDADGAIRRTPLILEHDNGLYGSLSLELARALYFVDEIELETESVGQRQALTGVDLGHTTVPTDTRGNVLVPFRHRDKEFDEVSATDVLNGHIAPDQLDGAIAMVGTSAIGLGDLVSTPVDARLPGVFIHALVLKGIMEESFPYRPDWAAGAELAKVVTTGVLLTLSLVLLSPWRMLAMGALVVSALVAGNVWLWTSRGIDLSLALPLLLGLGLVGVNLSDRLLRENRTRRRLHNMFGEYVPASHINAMLRDPEAYSFEGENRDMTVLFSDIRGFTPISESLSAAELKKLLNRFFTPVSRTVFENEGTIDKYVGDMIMAFWGAPLADAHHREHALNAALEIFEVVERLRPEFQAEGLPEINIGLGINSGLMNVGDMGSQYRRNYTVLGDAVNLGARLESVTKYYGAKLLVGEDTAEHCTGFEFRMVDRIQVKGKEVGVRVYELLGRAGEVAEEALARRDRHHQALEHFYQRDWDDAEALWQSLHEEAPGDRLYPLYLERIAGYRQSPPPGDWDGVWRHTEK